MRGEARVKEALGFVTLLWNHPILTGLLLLIFTPPFFPLVVYFSPLLMSTALCVVALVSVGSQMEKIKAEGGPGQLENHLGREHGISRWVPRDSSESMERRHYSHRESHRNPYASSGININVVPAPSSWTAGNSGRELTTIRTTPQLRPEPVETHPTTPPAEESDEDWWDTWVKEYESRPGWGEQEDQALPTPAIRTSTTSQPVAQAPTPPTIPTPVTARRDRHQDAPPVTRKPIRQEARQEEKSPPAAVIAPVAVPVAVSVAASVPAPVAAPVSIPVVNRQEAARFLPPPTSTSHSIQDEVVVAVKESDLRPHIFLAPIRTSREKRDVRHVNRLFSKPAAQASEIPPPRSMDVERVSDVQALQSIEKLLHMEMAGSNTAAPPFSVARNFASVADVKNAGLGNSSETQPQVGIARGAMGPQLNVVRGSGSASVMSTGKGIAVEASEKNRNKIAVGPPTPEDVAGETPLLRHLKTSRSEKQARSSAYSPLPVRTSRSLMSEKVLPPPQFSPRLLQSLQPLPPKGFSPRLTNLISAPLGNPVEKIPQWVYDGIPRNRAERAESQAHVKQCEKSEEKHVRAFEQVFSYTRRRTHARRPLPIQVDLTTLQGRLDVSTTSTPSLTLAEATPVSTRKETMSEQMVTSRVSPHRPASRASSPRRTPPAVVAEIVHTRISDVAIEVAHAADDLHEISLLVSTEMASVPVPTPRAFSPRVSPSTMAAGSPQRASVVASPRAASPQPASIAVSPRPASVASSPQKASVAASPRRASRASSPHKPSIVSSAPWPASVASSPQKLAPVGASPQRASVASSPQRASIAASRPPSRAPPAASSSPHRSSVPSSPSMPHSRRRRQSSKHCTDKVAFTRIEGSTYYDPPSAAEKEINLVAEEPPAAPSEEYVPIEYEVSALPTVETNEEVANSQTLTLQARSVFPEDEAALHWGRGYSATRKSRRRLEPRRVVTSQDSDMFSLKKSFSTRNGETKKFVDSSSDDERESVTPRASRRSMGRTIKPLVWRSRSVQAHEPADSD